MNIKNDFKNYLGMWQPAKATYDTHGWNGWYVKRHSPQCDYFPKKPNSTKKWAIAMAKKLNNRDPDAP